MKVLVSAYACSPYHGSEPGVGWGFVRALAEHHDLWVLVEEEKFRSEIERYLAGAPELGRSVRFHFLRKRRQRWLRKLWPPSYYWFYRQWHRDAYQVARRLHEEHRFDLAHQLTMVGFREPGYLWRLGIPFVWGPVGGMGLFPWRFLSRIGFRGAAYYLGYNLLNMAQMRWLARPRRAARAAGPGLIAATRENREGALRLWGRDATILCEVGLPREPVETISLRSPEEPFRIVWSGQHTQGKALHLGLEALAQIPAGLDWHLDVLGQGPETPRWQRLAARLGIASRCRFHGWLQRDRALEIMASGHLMLITSLRDLTSTVTVEALAFGLPIVCPDHCGFADVVDETCGLRIPVTTPDEFVVGLAAAVERIGRDEERRRELARGALVRAEAFTWERKAEVVDEIYRRTLQSAESRPG